jgi:tRNA pseudouridine13 synthase
VRKPCPYGETETSGIIRSRPEDFQVFECLGFEPSGEGEHLFLQVEKSGMTTAELIRRVARDYSIKPGNIGYSGLKDRNALTTQWLSLHLPARQTRTAVVPADGYRVLREVRNRSKLRQGSHKFNRFHLVIRAVDRFPDASRQQIESIAANGIANYFGRQRFGRREDNVAQALQRLPGPGLKPRQRGMLISALRSHLFNEVLSRRIRLGYWRQPLDGDLFMLRGSHSIFSAPLDRELLRRFDEMDISPSASLYGSGQCRLGGLPLEIEQQVLADNREITECLDQQGARLQMRALRVAAEDLEFGYDAGKATLELQLRLPAGSYMTTLLDHFIDVAEADFR